MGKKLGKLKQLNWQIRLLFCPYERIKKYALNFSKSKKVCKNCMFPERWNTAKVLTMFFMSTWWYLYKKFNSYDEFLSKANPAHLVAIFCPFLVCPQVNMKNNFKCISSKRALSHQDSWLQRTYKPHYDYQNFPH